MYPRAVLTSFISAVTLTTSTTSTGSASSVACTLQDLVTEGADVIFVTCSKEALNIPCYKLITSKYSIWTRNNMELAYFLRRNRIFNTQTIAFYVVPSRRVKSAINTFASKNATGTLIQWVLLLNRKDFYSHARSLNKSAIHVDVTAVNIDQMGIRRFFRCEKGVTENRCSLSTSFVSRHNRRSDTNPDLFSGETMRLGCLIVGDYDTCVSERSLKLIKLLSQKNVTVKLVKYRWASDFYRDIYADKIDLGLAKTEVREHSLALLSFGDMEFGYHSFYALDNNTRVMSLFDALCSSNCGIFVFFGISCCAISAALSKRKRTLFAYLQCALNEAFFLLAPLLGTSAQVPLSQGTSHTHDLVYFVWIMAILPFSVYFRSTLVSLVTVRRPADVLDTLSELEKALDLGTVLPCVKKGASEHAELEERSNEGGVLLRKLRLAYRHHKGNDLLKPTSADCFRCAREQNRVCFITQYPICAVKNRFSEIGEFKETFMVDLWVLPMNKESKLRRRFKHFMYSVREGSLLNLTSSGCYKNPSTGDATDDLFPFLANWFVLLCFSGVVLSGELFVARFCPRT